MLQNKISILSTRPIGKTLVQQANVAGIAIDELSFIETEFIRDIYTQQEIENIASQSATIVFTSMNAVESVVEELWEQSPEWDIYCIGNNTQKKVREYFGENSITGTAGNAADLADLIVENGVEEVFFFCGDRRRDELPEILQKNDVVINEIVVYRTRLVTHNIAKKYNGIMFFSPSAVESFFSTNKITDDVIFFAIGATTANEIKKHSSNKIITLAEPSSGNLVNLVMKYYR